MTTEEFNDMKGREREQALKDSGYDGMYASRESSERDSKLEKYWADMPNDNDYNGPF